MSTNEQGAGVGAGMGGSAGSSGGGAQGGNVANELVLPGGGKCTLGLSLLQLGNFVLNSGKKSRWKLECDALTDADWDAAAYMVWKVAGPFDGVVGVPTGGLRLSARMRQYSCYDPRDGSFILASVKGLPRLIVDDVLTTGGSMERTKQKLYEQAGVSEKERPDLFAGAVLFARGPCPPWIKAVFQMAEPLWISSEDLVAQ
jgi:hypothetical protein